MFLEGTEIATYLRSLEGSGVTKVQEIDFEALKSEAAASATTLAPARSAAVAAPKDEGKIEGAVQTAIGVKKDVNFPDWYTNVCMRFITS